VILTFDLRSGELAVQYRKGEETAVVFEMCGKGERLLSHLKVMMLRGSNLVSKWPMM